MVIYLIILVNSVLSSVSSESSMVVSIETNRWAITVTEVKLVKSFTSIAIVNIKESQVVSES